MKNKPALRSSEYVGIHNKVRRRFGPAKNYDCAACYRRQALDWACLDDYHNLDDYWPLCRSCHRTIDATELGSNNNQAKLTEDQVIDIKIRLAKGERGVDIAKLYGVKRGAISMINRGHNWSHIVVGSQVLSEDGT